jgi:hypothetical protein
MSTTCFECHKKLVKQTLHDDGSPLNTQEKQVRDWFVKTRRCCGECECCASACWNKPGIEDEWRCRSCGGVSTRSIPTWALQGFVTFGEHYGIVKMKAGQGWYLRYLSTPCKQSWIDMPDDFGIWSCPVHGTRPVGRDCSY